MLFQTNQEMTADMKPHNEVESGNSVFQSTLPAANQDLYHFDEDLFWQHVPAWKTVSKSTFGDHRWQLRNSLSSIEDVKKVMEGKLDEDLFEDMLEGQRKAPMNIRLTPYIFSRIDWNAAESDPIRRQFLPMASQFQANHPCEETDSLGEETDRVTPHLTHRYHDKALFLPITICPVYCSYCTRSRVVGGSTASRSKTSYGAQQHAWDASFNYLQEHKEVEDVVISGGDAALLKPDQLEYIGYQLLKIPHIRRIRFATKGLAILPMQITSDQAWFQALSKVHALGRKMMKEVCVHTHFETANEITSWTLEAMHLLSREGITVRNQSVLLNGVNDNFESMYALVKKLSYIRIQPYYVYMHDLIPGCEHLRTPVSTAETLSKELLGATAGFNLPRFVCDAPGGGGKREISSFEDYHRTYGITSWTAPRVKPGEVFFYYDPIHTLNTEGKDFWSQISKDPQNLNGVLQEMKESILSQHEA